MSLDPLLQASPVIQIHAAAAFLAFVFGAIQLYRKKGDRLHRAIGSTWVGLMAIVALSSFLIWTIRIVWVFSPIHLISIFVLVMLWLGVRADAAEADRLRQRRRGPRRRRHDRRHRPPSPAQDPDRHAGGVAF